MAIKNGHDHRFRLFSRSKRSLTLTKPGSRPHCTHVERKTIAAILLNSLVFIAAGVLILRHDDSWLTAGLIVLSWGIGGVGYSVLLVLGNHHK